MTRLLFGGDVMLGRGVGEALRAMRPADPWGDLLPILRGADARIVNLECALTGHRDPWRRTPKVFHFRADAPAADVLTAANIDAVSLANNHVLDFEEAGLLDTLAALDRAGVARAGAGRNLAEAKRAALVSALPARVALLAATDNEPAFAATGERPGTHWFPIDLDVATLTWIGDAVREARAQGADLVVLSLHWGPNMVVRPPPVFRRFAQAAIERGVDVIHGHSAHVFQGIEVHRGRPILYDTGDLIDDYAVDPILRNDWSFLFQVDFDGKRFAGLTLVPVRLYYAVVRRAPSHDAEEMMQRMAGLSLELGTRLEPREDTLVYEPPS